MVEQDELKWLLTAEDKATSVLNKLKSTILSVDTAIDNLNKKLNSSNNINAGVKNYNNESRNKIANIQKETLETKKLISAKKNLKNVENNRSKIRNVIPFYDENDGAFNKKGFFAKNLLGNIKSESYDLSQGIKKITTEQIRNNKKITRDYLKYNDGSLYQIGAKTTPINNLPNNKKSFKDYLKEGKKVLSFNSKLLKSFGRIATYRVIRTILSGIANSFKDGFTNIASSSAVARESLIQLKTFSTSLSISLSSMLMPAVQMLTSLLEPLSSALIDTANEMAKEQAISSGASTYYKINAQAVKNYAKELQGLSGQLTELDKFATLSKGNPILGSEVNIETNPLNPDNTKQTTTNAKNFATILRDISSIISDIVKLLVNMDISEIKSLAGILLWFSTGFVGKAASIIMAITTIFDKDATSDAKIMASSILALTAAVLAYKAAVAGGLTFAGRISSVILAATTVMTVSGLISSFFSNSYAQGGFPDSGSLFIANEAGPEMVGTIGGRTAVANNDQIVESVSTGVYSAVSRALAENNRSSNGGGNVYLDGKVVGKVITQDVYYNGVKSGFWGK